MPVELQGKPVASKSSAANEARPIPTSFTSAPRLQFSYSGSPDGVDTNLLILLHGRGDNEKPFAKLASTLKLPQTASLALRGPLVVPLLDEGECEWWNETDMLGMAVPDPDPTKAISLLCDITRELQEPPYYWQSDRIHLFGFGQGGTLACETALRTSHDGTPAGSFGSVVSIQGPLLSLPPNATSDADKSNTKILYVARERSQTAKSKANVTALERRFRRVQRLALLPQAIRASADEVPVAMPQNKAEWQGIMEFWSEHLSQTSAWQRSGEVYEVTSGMSANHIKTAHVTESAKEGTENVLGETAQSASSLSPASGVAKAKNATKTQSAGLKRGFLSRGL